MNEINAAQRLKEAAKEKGEADKTLRVKAAEAEKESKILQGHGISGQRKAIVDGLKESVSDMKKVLGEEVSEKDVMAMILTTQYFGTLKEVGSSSKSNVIFIPNSPGATHDMMSQIMSGNIGAYKATENINGKEK